MPKSGSRVLIVGASGMLGSALMRRLSVVPGLHVTGTVRDASRLPDGYLAAHGEQLISKIDPMNQSVRSDLVAKTDVVINAVGVIKHAEKLSDRPGTVEVNALLPHLLAGDCEAAGRRLIHVSTDCVFSGERGAYSEDDNPDPVDFYGRSKLLGEVAGSALTLRTSIIGHELQRHSSLIDWFLSQPPDTPVAGYVNAIYSGVTTDEFADLIARVVIPDESLGGLYHVASAPITKFDLLKLVADRYGWAGEVFPDPELRCDRSMTANRFAAATGYRPPSWSEMIDDMAQRRAAWPAIGTVVAR